MVRWGPSWVCNMPIAVHAGCCLGVVVLLICSMLMNWTIRESKVLPDAMYSVLFILMPQHIRLLVVSTRRLAMR